MDLLWFVKLWNTFSIGSCGKLALSNFDSRWIHRPQMHVPHMPRMPSQFRSQGQGIAAFKPNQNLGVCSQDQHVELDMFQRINLIEICSKARNNTLDLDGKNFTPLHSSPLLLLCFSSPSLIARMPDLVVLAPSRTDHGWIHLDPIVTVNPCWIVAKGPLRFQTGHLPSQVR